MRPIQQLRVAARPVYITLTSYLRKHRAVAHVSLSGLAILAALAISFQGATAGPTPEKTRPASILPVNIGIGLQTTASVAVRFPAPMDHQSAADALSLNPSTAWRTSWSADGRTLRLVPEHRWLTDARYVVRVGAGAQRADGRPIGSALNLAFTTETAPTVADFQLFYVAETAGDRARAVMEADADEATGLQITESPSPDTASDVSAATRITVGFSTLMNRADVERRFAIRPFVPGSLSWEGNALVFEPSARLADGARYAVSVVGAHDARGNRLAGDASFSFTTRAGAQVVKVAPASGATETNANVKVWFSQPMDTPATSAGLSVADVTSGAKVTGKISWNAAGTQVTFTPSAALPNSHTFRIALSATARDVDRNEVTGAWSFSTKAAPAPPPASRPVVSPPAGPAGPPPPSDIQQYALWQINNSRAAYGFAPLRLDAAITAVASAHAWDMMNYGYFSHTGRDGSRVSDRLRRAGISFSSSGENICYNTGLGVKATLNWCHGVFMSEPYPGYPNHIGNILSPRFTRVGIGIAQSGGRIKIVWDFAG